MNGIQEVSGSIPLISTNSREWKNGENVMFSPFFFTFQRFSISLSATSNGSKRLAVSLAACGSKPVEESQPEQSQSAEQTGEVQIDEPQGGEPVEERPVVNLAVLSGLTGIGAAKLLADSHASLLYYTECF